MIEPAKINKRLEGLYRDADKTVLLNFGSKRLPPIRLKLPKPPPLNYINGYGKYPQDQVFERLEIPDKLTDLEKECYDFIGTKGTMYDVISRFWEQLEIRKRELKNEVLFMKTFVWHMHNGYWFFNDGKPTYMSGWCFSYLNMHHMTLRKGSGYPSYDERLRRRWLYRDYIFKTDETFRDRDEKGKAIKMNGKYRMKKKGKRLFYGTIEPKGRREGLTNEFTHMILRIVTETRGSDNLGTIVSMDGDNAGVHFKKKLVPAFKRWPLWLMPVWKGGVTEIVFDVPKGVINPDIEPLESSINYTESGGDLANDGKKIMAAGFDEQGKGKRIGDVGNRWQINKETMSLEAGSDILGFCIHPSTVEKMEEGGKDYREMCDISNFYIRQDDGQTVSGLAISYMPSSFCLRGYTDKFGNPVLLKPTPRQIKLGYDREIGGKIHITRRRKHLYDEGDEAKMDAYRSFVRKYPEDYDDCWKGVSGYIGFPVEEIENRLLDIQSTTPWRKGRLEWIDGKKLGKVEFIDDENGSWWVSKIPNEKERNLKTTMEYYSAFHDEYVPMFRPANPDKGVVGIDPHEFNNKGESIALKNKFTKLSNLGITVYQKRDKNIDVNDFDKKNWKTPRALACYNSRIATNYEAAEEALKAAIYWGYLIHLERNKTELYSHIIKWEYGGYLNHEAEILPDGRLQITPEPGTYLQGVSKKRVFSLMKDQLTNHISIETLPPLLQDALNIGTMEELTKYDTLASYMAALDGARSIYAEVMAGYENDEVVTINALGKVI